MTLLTPHAVDPVEDAAAMSALRLAAARLNDSSVPAQLIAGNELFSLPDEVADAFRDLLERFAKGETVVIGSTSTLLTTSEAADFLGISRTYVVQLIDEGKLDVEYRGTHRRVSLADVVRFREQSRGSRHARLDEISELTARSGGYDGDPF